MWEKLLYQFWNSWGEKCPIFTIKNNKGIYRPIVYDAESYKFSIMRQKNTTEMTLVSLGGPNYLLI